MFNMYKNIVAQSNSLVISFSFLFFNMTKRSDVQKGVSNEKFKNCNDTIIYLCIDNNVHDEDEYTEGETQQCVQNM